MVQVYLKYTPNTLWKYTSSIFEVYLKYIYFTLVRKLMCYETIANQLKYHKHTHLIQLSFLILLYEGILIFQSF